MTNETENPLEAALRLAAAEPAHRPEFYRLLLDSTVYILSPFAGQESGERTFQTDEEIAIQHWTRKDGSPVIPFFTSLAVLERSIEGESGYIALPARSLLEMTKGSTLVLNPRSEFGKEFPPAEIEALLTVGLNHVPNRRVVEKETRILLGPPATRRSWSIPSPHSCRGTATSGQPMSRSCTTLPRTRSRTSSWESMETATWSR